LDLTPINPETGLLKNLLEVFKYIGKPYSNEAGENVLPAAVVEQLEKNSREKFNNRFGILYKVKELALNADQDERQDKEIGPLYIVKTPFIVNKKIEFIEIDKLPDSLDLKDVLQNWALSTTRDLEREREKYQNAAFQRAYSRERLRNWTLPANLGRQTNAINEDPIPLPY
jgi:cobalamin-dependent methionine synthase I